MKKFLKKVLTLAMCTTLLAGTGITSVSAADADSGISTAAVERDYNYWNFSDEAFSDVRFLTESKTVNGLTFNVPEGTSNFSAYGSSQTFNGISFKNAIVMDGSQKFVPGASDHKGTISFEVSGPTIIYVAAKAKTDKTTTDAYIKLYENFYSPINAIDGESFNQFKGFKRYYYSGSSSATIAIACGGEQDMNIFGILTRPYVEDNSSVNKFWSLGSMFTDDTLDSEIDGVKLNFDEEHDIKLSRSGDATAHGVVYTGYVNLNGRGTIDYRNISFYSPLGTDIYITARSSDHNNPETERELLLTDYYGFKLGSVKVTDKVETFKIHYSGNYLGGQTLRLMSTDSGIEVFRIRVITRDDKGSMGLDGLWDFDESRFDNYTTTKSFEALTLCSPLTFINLEKPLNGHSRAIVMEDGGTLYSRTAKVDVIGSATVIFDIAAYLSADSKEVEVMDKYGTILERETIYPGMITPLTVNYEGSENTIYIRSEEDGESTGFYLCQVTVDYEDDNTLSTLKLENSNLHDEIAIQNSEIVSEKEKLEESADKISDIFENDSDEEMDIIDDDILSETDNSSESVEAAEESENIEAAEDTEEADVAEDIDITGSAEESAVEDVFVHEEI